MKLKATINPEHRTALMAKSALLEIKAMPDETSRYNKALELLQNLTKMIEKVSSNPDNDLITRTFHACSKAWTDFAQKCPSVIDGYKPTGAWFKQVVVQIAVKEGEEITENLRHNFKNLGWSGLLEDYLYPKGRDEKEMVIEIDVELR
jgi:hypothetical protein